MNTIDEIRARHDRDVSAARTVRRPAMSYHNTTNSSGPQLHKYETTAQSQEAVILGFLNQHPAGGYTPSRIQKLCLPGAPITSVRRALSNLTRDGKVRKTVYQVKGPYGRPEYVWTIASPQLELL